MKYFTIRKISTIKSNWSLIWEKSFSKTLSPAGIHRILFMHRIGLIILNVFLLFSTCYGQLENAHWFLYKDIDINFNSGSPVASTRINNFERHTENSVVVSDENGSVIFYSAGEEIWNNGNQVILNGDDLGGNSSSTQGTVVVQSETNPNTFHIFTLENVGTDDGSSLFHSVLNLTRNGGAGEIVSARSELWNNLTEKMVAVPNPCGGAWIVVHERDNNNYLSFLLEEDKVEENPVISSVGSNHTSWQGQLVPNSAGNRFAALTQDGLFELVEFENITGFVINPLTVYQAQIGSNRFYSGAFSKNDSLFYLDERGMNPNIGTNSSIVTQYQLSGTAGQILSSRSIVGYLDNAQFRTPIAFKMGLDGSLYIAVSSYTSLNRIQYPDRVGLACLFQHEYLPVSAEIETVNLPQDLVNAVKKDWFELPEDTVICQDDDLVIDLSNVDADLQWDDGTTEKVKIFSDEGLYHVLAIDSNTCEYRDTLHFDFHDVNDQIVDTVLCPGQFIIIGKDSIRLAGTYVDTSEKEICLTEKTFNIDFFSNHVDTTTIEIRKGGTYTWHDSIFSQPGLYVWSFQDENGCESLEFLSLSLKANDPFVPNAFSPNYDNVNDELLVYTDTQDQRQVTNFAIYDRWGQLIYQQPGPLSPTEIVWNGKIDNSDAPPGVYLYHLTMKSNDASSSFTGSVHLIR